MPRKDYYQVLGITPSASAAAVKQAFRRLVMRYHPDKNPSAAAAAVFREISEAYEVLGNAASRRSYDQQRWQETSATALIITDPQVLLLHGRELAKKVQQYDPLRIDRDKLYFELNHLLSAYHLQLLETQASPDLNQAILETLLDAATPLEYTSKQALEPVLSRLAEQSATGQDLLRQFMQSARNQRLRARMTVPAVLLLTLLACLLIYLLTQ
ncbi:MAG: J domain-containing protein [Chitinophagaceae bacterium]|nr:J domain-containing protein [Chitinophagaceae bacterium]